MPALGSTLAYAYESVRHRVNGICANDHRLASLPPVVQLVDIVPDSVVARIRISVCSRVQNMR